MTLTGHSFARLISSIALGTVASISLPSCSYVHFGAGSNSSGVSETGSGQPANIVTTSAADQGGNGHGYEGMRYIVADLSNVCSDKKEVSTIYYKSGSAVAFLSRANCRDIEPPTELTVNAFPVFAEDTISAFGGVKTISLNADGSTTLVYSDLIYSASPIDSPASKVTVAYCSGGATARADVRLTYASIEYSLQTSTYSVYMNCLYDLLSVAVSVFSGRFGFDPDETLFVQRAGTTFNGVTNGNSVSLAPVTGGSSVRQTSISYSGSLYDISGVPVPGATGFNNLNSNCLFNPSLP